MKRSQGWLSALALLALLGSLGYGARPEPSAARAAARLRTLVQEESRLLAEARAASDAAAPGDFQSACRYAVRLLRVLEQRRLLPSTPVDGLEDDLPQALRRCDLAAQSLQDQEIADGLRIRAAKLLEEMGPETARDALGH
ncbi:MAG: hypothetical protein ACO1SX_06380 [Actinomycetota bacterium]